jgi:hypothetical protein
MCTAPEAQVISQLQKLELAQLLISKQIYQRTVATSIDRRLRIRIKKLVTTESFTRLGLFTYEQQDALSGLIDRLHLDGTVVKHIGMFIHQCVKLTAQALFDLISLRNAVAHNRKNSVKEHQTPKPTGSRFAPLCCDDDIQNLAAAEILQMQIYFPRRFLQVPRAQAQVILAVETPHLMEQLLSIAVNVTESLSHMELRTMCQPLGQAVVGRQRIPKVHPSIDDIVFISPSVHISDYSCDASDHKATFRIMYSQRMSLLDCQTLSLKIARDYQVIPILHYISQKIKKYQRHSDIGKQWLSFYHRIYQYILSFSDYIEYLSWHYQTVVDDIFTAGIMSIAEILCNDQNTTIRWSYRLNADLDSRTSCLSNRTFRFTISTANAVRETAVILSRYSPRDTVDRIPLSSCDLIKYNNVIVTTETETILQFQRELRSLCERYNVNRTQNSEIDNIRRQLLILRSTVKHSTSVSNIDKISFTNLISRYAMRLYTTHRINSAASTSDIRTFFPPASNGTDQPDHYTVSSSRSFDLKGD